MNNNDIQTIREVIEACRKHEMAVASRSGLDDVVEGLAISATKLETILDRNTCTKGQGKKLLALLKEKVRETDKNLRDRARAVKKMPSIGLLVAIQEAVTIKLELIEACSEAMKAAREGNDPVVAVRRWLHETRTYDRLIGYECRPIRGVLVDLDRYNAKIEARRIVYDLLVIVMGVGG